MKKFVLSLAALLVIGGSAAAQTKPLVIPPTAIPPDPKSIVSVLPTDLVWKTESLGQLQAPLFGDPTKPGVYGVAIKWLPGQMSHPHFHTTDRWAYVAKGTWWVSSTSHYDPATTWPVPEGTFGIDLANKVHWDGAKDEEVILIVLGMGPMDSKTVEDKK